VLLDVVDVDADVEVDTATPVNGGGCGAVDGVAATGRVRGAASDVAPRLSAGTFCALIERERRFGVAPWVAPVSFLP